MVTNDTSYELLRKASLGFFAPEPWTRDDLVQQAWLMGAERDALPTTKRAARRLINDALRSLTKSQAKSAPTWVRYDPDKDPSDSEFVGAWSRTTKPTDGRLLDHSLEDLRPTQSPLPERLLACVKAAPGCGVGQLARLAGTTETTARLHLQRLVERGVLRQQAAAPGHRAPYVVCVQC